MTDTVAARKYGIIVLGASGFTGTQVCLHIAAQLPTNLQWAITGRSRERLEKLAARLKHEYPDRLQPDIEVFSPDDPDHLGQAVAKAKVCISNVMYPLDGEKVIRACVDNQTDYLDSAAVPTLVQSWIAKYHEKAEQNGVALIHACGALTGAMDIMAVEASHQIASRWSGKLGEMTLRIDDLDTNVSGGTFRTVVSYATAGPKAMAEVEQPSALSPIPYTTKPNVIPGIHRNPVLGLLSNSSPSADQVRALVNRTWGLLGGPESSWGPNFQYNEYDRASSYFSGVMNIVRCWVIATIFGLARFDWFKNLLLSLAPPPGAGPSSEAIKSVPVKMQALVAADLSGSGKSTRIRGKYCYLELTYSDGHYPFAGLIMAQAGATLLYSRKLSAGIKGGCLTPGTLGQELVNRVKAAGLELRLTLLDNDK